MMLHTFDNNNETIKEKTQTMLKSMIIVFFFNGTKNFIPLSHSLLLILHIEYCIVIIFIVVVGWLTDVY